MKQTPGASVSRTFFWLLRIAFHILAVLALSQTSPPAANTGTARQSFKNLRILGEISADQLLPTMQFISASLGVECDFCHVRDAFEKDDKKPKQTARLMMQMMLAINKQDFRGERAVTCFTCHRGSIRPVSIPMLDQNAAYLNESNTPEPVQNSTTAGLPSPED